MVLALKFEVLEKKDGGRTKVTGELVLSVRAIWTTYAPVEFEEAASLTTVTLPKGVLTVFDSSCRLKHTASTRVRE